MSTWRERLHTAFKGKQKVILGYSSGKNYGFYKKVCAKMKKAAIYVRVSTNEQSPAMQLSDLRRYAQQRGYQIYQEYVDVGVSGTKVNRPALDALMDAARKRLFDVVLVWRLSCCFDTHSESSCQNNKKI